MGQVYYLNSSYKRARIGWRVVFTDAMGTPRYWTWALTERGAHRADRAWRSAYYRPS